MVPPMQSRLRYVTSTILLVLAFYAALYGVSYAYTLHQVADIFCAWLVLVLWFTGSWELEKMIGNVVSGSEEARNKKRP
jgi:asparagine N-glycosylation enzyme membrane subunit Stt3